MSRKTIDNFIFNKKLVKSVVEVYNLEEFLDINRSERPEVFVDGNGQLRVALMFKSVIFVSTPVDVLAVVVQAQEYPGESLADTVMNCIEHQRDWPRKTSIVERLKE